MKNFALLAVVGLAAGANAQSLSFAFPGGNTYNGGANVKVELWANFNSTTHMAWAGSAVAVNGDASGAFSNVALGNPVPPPGTTPGTPSGGNVGGIVAGQLHFPPLFFANTANPILIWSGEWSTGNLTARTVDLSTLSTKLTNYLPSGSSQNLTGWDEAKGTIEVVPAPSALALLGLGGLVAGRRRR